MTTEQYCINSHGKRHLIHTHWLSSEWLWEIERNSFKTLPQAVCSHEVREQMCHQSDTANQQEKATGSSKHSPNLRGRQRKLLRWNLKVKLIMGERAVNQSKSSTAYISRQKYWRKISKPNECFEKKFRQVENLRVELIICIIYVHVNVFKNY